VISQRNGQRKLMEKKQIRIFSSRISRASESRLILKVGFHNQLPQDWYQSIFVLMVVLRRKRIRMNRRHALSATRATINFRDLGNRSWPERLIELDEV